MTNTSNSVFHFTNKKNLLRILENCFLPKYCKERIIDSGTEKDYWIPMVCFCDIPLSQVNNHIKEYGNYGIGLNKEWVLKSKINPILYYNHDSNIFNKYSQLLGTIEFKMKSNTPHSIIENIDMFISAKQLFTYFKLYEGYDFKMKKNKIFYTEREWRYVPKFDENDTLIIKDRMDIYTQLSEENLKLHDNPLVFELKDISFIIIKKENERLGMLSLLKKIESKKYNHDEVEALTTKIISCEQIINDM